ncbi:hypothetical protein L6R49_19135 [Myxococcota bacterium]|nr:hypothetical protein [Myxococcota bacterium]
MTQPINLAHPRKIFLNLPVRDLEATKEFFGKLGFSFNPMYTDQNAACMVLNDEAFVMLLLESRFRDFTPKAICDTRTHVEGLFAITCDSRAEVDHMFETALAAGATAMGEAVDYGFMYQRNIYDLDGHHWELFYTDITAFPGQGDAPA